MATAGTNMRCRLSAHSDSPGQPYSQGPRAHESGDPREAGPRWAAREACDGGGTRVRLLYQEERSMAGPCPVANLAAGHVSSRGALEALPWDRNVPRVAWWHAPLK